MQIRIWYINCSVIYVISTGADRVIHTASSSVVLVQCSEFYFGFLAFN